ncbi:hypothetical protein BaRGS_00014781 [Batillaria attramentaria]|uniref:Uncharacterized protein n=1 Tax=Batillaria attramentaria TaxID=370345 RepID=A0ABD0L452_9CAEN
MGSKPKENQISDLAGRLFAVLRDTMNTQRLQFELSGNHSFADQPRCDSETMAVAPLTDVTGQGEGGGAVADSGLLTTSTPQHVVCPNGWVRGTLSGQLFQETARNSVCLYVSHQPETWHSARAECHNRNSFLVSLEDVLSVENAVFHQYLANIGITDVWTGLHNEAGRQLWDDPDDGMARPYFGSERSYGEARRGWAWDLTSFDSGNLTCGLYSVSPPHDVTNHRERREASTTSKPTTRDKTSRPSTVSTQEGAPPKGAVVPTEKSLESLKTFLSDQGMKKFADKINDSPSGSDDTKTPKAADNTTADPVSSDDDEAHDVTKRSTQPIPEHTTEDPLAAGNMSKSSEDVANPSDNSSSTIDGSENNAVTTPIPNTSPQLSSAVVQDTTTTPSNVTYPPNATATTQQQLIQNGNETSQNGSSSKTSFNEELLNRFRTGTGEPNSSPKSQTSTPVPASEFIRRFHTQILDEATRSNDTSITTEPNAATEKTTQQSNPSQDENFTMSAKDFIKRFKTGLLREVTAKNRTPSVRTGSATAFGVTPGAEKTSFAPVANSTVGEGQSNVPVFASGNTYQPTDVLSTEPPPLSTTNASSEESTTDSSEDVDDTTMATTHGVAPITNIPPTVSFTGFSQHFGPGTFPPSGRQTWATAFPATSGGTERTTTVSSSDIFSGEYTTSTIPVVTTDSSLEDTSVENTTSTPIFRSTTVEKQYDETKKDSTTFAQLREILSSISTPSPDPTSSPSNRQTMGLHQCDERHPFVCAAKPVKKLAPAGQCERGWLGHSLLSRCYKPVPLRAEYHEASRHCEMEDAKLAIVDSPFFANVTAILVDMMDRLNGFGGSAWVDTTTNTATPPDGLCGVAEPDSLSRRSCTSTLPFICQKLARSGLNMGDDNKDALLNKKVVIQNMTSSDPRPLLCPIHSSSHDDVVVWYKDGKPVPPDPTPDNSRSPGILQLNVKLLRRLGVSERRLQPALLQGMYWCRVWRQYPLQSLTSHRMFVRFRDVITLNGFVKSSNVSMETAIFFNEMGYAGGLPGIIATDLQQMNGRIYESVHQNHPYLSDIVTEAVHVDASTGETEFKTYLCLSTVGLPYSAKGAVVDSYLRALHTELIANEDSVRNNWYLPTPFEQAFRIMMTEMCSETRLFDNSTGHEATFPSTPVNQQAVSQESCDGVFVGYAVCSGDLQRGAEWSDWIVDTSCEDNDSKDSENDGKDTEMVDRPNQTPSTPDPLLLELTKVPLSPGTVSGVSDRLAHILHSSEELTYGDVGIVADIVDRVALVPTIPPDVGLQLLQSVSRVLDSPLPVLQKAQRVSNASTRILSDLDLFGEKLDLDQEGFKRYVTPNVAMEVWHSRRSSGKPVIGFAAISAGGLTTPFSESRIMTISDRTWADVHMDEFDVAIELPDQLVKGTAADSRRNVRLTMAVFRNAGLFLSSSTFLGDTASSELNSAVISASFGGQKIEHLQERVQLIFRPNTTDKNRPTRCVFWDFSLSAGGGWSQKGCTYNGTVRGREICLCNHLTNFAVLLDYYGSSRPIDSADDLALNILSMIGLSLSILGLALTIITFLFFKKLRQGRAQQTLFNVAVALFCTDTLILVGFKQTANDHICLFVAVLLHYFILVSFAWMLIEAVLQYLTFVKVLGTYISKYTLKTVLPAWGAPLIPVIAVLSIDHRLYRGRQDYCWMDLTAFYYAFALPVGVIVLFNLVMFVVIMVSLVRRPEGLRSNRSKSQTVETNVKAAFTIFILLGLTWIFGFLAISHARLTFQYVFTVLSSLQGFFVFMLLVARRRQFREQWRVLCCRLTRQPRSRQVTPTISNSTSSNSSGGSFSSASNSSTKTLRSFLSHGYGNGGGEETESAGKCKVHPRHSANLK